ncbi:AraC family transcriptional regulator [Actinomadura sp. DC4]|uniref:AraC family transcriptional regulator n=1 Tax=Actinomadura sp. DC4 TaxID=3055069 RepID=UPI0025AEFBF2|nr:AraC family transcriptional regulator [Actinomadura sp. DC4]MDN3359666.1 AraC family transcriptional regulator [Actinomadura sp. DC4]
MSGTPEYLLDRPGDRVDPLSEVLTLLDVRAALPSRFEAGGRWALRFERHHHVKVGALLAGRCWLTPEGAEPVLLRPGDCYLLASGRPYTSASDPEVEPVDGHAVFEGVHPGTVRHNVAAGDLEPTILVGGSVTFDETAAALLLDHLPPCVRIGADSHRAQVLRPILELLGEETAGDAPGSMVMREQLTQILFVQALRTLLIADELPGWLGALTDDSVGVALAAIHREPARHWTVAELAAVAGLSRSTFALRFKTLVGLPPLDYLGRWRIRSAARALRSGERTVGSVAAEFGYGSESAFSNAFKRVTGHPPARHRRVAGG